MLKELRALLLSIYPKHLNAVIILFGKDTPREKVLIIYEESK